MNSDFKDLLKIFVDEKVKFLVIGGYAVMYYTEPRYTKDLDILIGSSNANAAKVMQALNKFGAPLLNGICESDFSKEGVFYQIGLAPNRIDIITSIPGVDFDKAYENKISVNIGGVLVPFIGLSDLIAAKLAAGRPQDLVDAGALAKVKQ